MVSTAATAPEMAGSRPEALTNASIGAALSTALPASTALGAPPEPPPAGPAPHTSPSAAGVTPLLPPLPADCVEEPPPLDPEVVPSEVDAPPQANMSVVAEIEKTESDPVLM